MVTAEAAFTEALSKFKARLSSKEINNFEFATLNDVRATAIRIQYEQEGVKQMVHMARLESFLEAMNQFGKVVEIFVNASSFVAFIWGPMKFVLQVIV